MSHTANWKLRSTNKLVWKYEGNSCAPRNNPNAEFENTMIAYVGDTLIDDCFGFVKVMGQYENGSLLIRKNSGQGEEQARTEGHVKVSPSDQLVADRLKYFKETEAEDDSEEESDGADGESVQTASGLGADGGIAAAAFDGCGGEVIGGNDATNTSGDGGPIAEGDCMQTGDDAADESGGGGEAANPGNATGADEAKGGNDLQGGSPVENLPLALGKEMESELLAYKIAPEAAVLGFFKETVMYETLQILAEQDVADATKLRLMQHGVVRCKDSGYYFSIVALHKPIAGFKVADGAAGDTLSREDASMTLEKCRSSSYFGFSARTGVVGPPRFQSTNEFVAVLWNLKFGLVYKTFDARNIAESFSLDSPANVDARSTLGEAPKLIVEKLHDEWHESNSKTMADGAIVFSRKAFSGLHVLAQQKKRKIRYFFSEAERKENEEQQHPTPQQESTKTRTKRGRRGAEVEESTPQPTPTPSMRKRPRRNATRTRRAEVEVDISGGDGVGDDGGGDGGDGYENSDPQQPLPKPRKAPRLVKQPTPPQLAPNPTAPPLQPPAPTQQPLPPLPPSALLPSVAPSAAQPAVATGPAPQQLPSAYPPQGGHVSTQPSSTIPTPAGQHDQAALTAPTAQASLGLPQTQAQHAHMHVTQHAALAQLNPHYPFSTPMHAAQQQLMSAPPPQPQLYATPHPYVLPQQQQAAARMYENMRARIELEELQLQQRRDMVSARLRYEVSQANLFSPFGF